MHVVYCREIDIAQLLSRTSRKEVLARFLVFLESVPRFFHFILGIGTQFAAVRQMIADVRVPENCCTSEPFRSFGVSGPYRG
jgi:hypothetical protein